MKQAVYYLKAVEVIAIKKVPLGEALFFGKNEDNLIMVPAGSYIGKFNIGDKVDIQISFNKVLDIKKGG